MKKISIIAIVACAIIAAVSCNNQPKNAKTATEGTIEAVEVAADTLSCCADTTKCCADTTKCCCADSVAVEAAK